MADERAQIRFRLLGPVEAAIGGEPVDLGGPKRRAVLARLLLEAGRVVSRERLIDSVWGEDAPATAANALQVQVHGLRRALGDELIETVGSGYRIAADADVLDVLRFDELVRRARNEAAPAAAATLREALGLWSGAALGGVDAPFAGVEVERLEEERLAAQEDRIDRDLECGRDAELVPELEALAAEHPYRERLCVQLATALYRAGRQADALERLRDARRTLRDELGLEPGPKLRELEAAILRHDDALAPVRGTAEPRLPTPVRPLIGRTLELAAVVGLLRRDDVRLLTLTGPGGTGKTRLALEAARELADGYAGGAFFVDLSAVRDPALVTSTIARAAGTTETADDPAAALAAHFGGRSVLLVLDNFEQVVDAAPALARLLATTRALDLLVTSRTPLRIGAETEYPVPPLQLPDAGAPSMASSRSDAVALFVACAAEVDRRFTLSEDNAQHVAEICRAVDGLPLAIELAAARVNLLAPGEIVERLERPLDVLGSSRRDAPDRQRTLRTTIEWSRALLEANAQVLFSRLAVFAGGFRVDAAERVCSATLDALDALVAQNLLRAHDAGGERRFAMLETIREYAFERLHESGEHEQIARTHAEHYAALAEELAPKVFFDDTLLTTLDHEHGNLRAALAWSHEADARLYVRLAIALWRFWYLRSLYREGRAHLDAAVALAAGLDRAALADAAKGAAILAVEQGDVSTGQAHATLALEAYRELGDERGTLTALTVLGNASRNAADADDARRRFEESASIAERLGLDEDVAVAHANLAAVAADVGDFKVARGHLRRSLAVYRAAGRTEALAIGLGTLAYAELKSGRTAEAVAAAVESIEFASTLGFRHMISSSLVTLAAAVAGEEPRRAAELLGAADAVGAGADEPFEPRDRALRDEVSAALRARLGEARFEDALAAGHEQPLESLVRDHAQSRERR